MLLKNVNAYRKRGCSKGLILHSDQELQYTAKAFTDLLKKLGIQQSFIKWYIGEQGYSNLRIRKCEIKQTVYYPDNRRHDIDNGVPKFILDNCETRNALGEIGIDIVKRNGANLFISGSNPIHQLQSIFLPTFPSVPLVKNPAEIPCKFST